MSVGVDDAVNNSVKISASPTTTFRLDLAADIRGTTTLSTINKVVLVDTGGVERDYSSISTSDWSISVNTASAVKNISITASYTFNMIRLYAGAKKYFEASVVSRSVTPGQTVRVGIGIIITATNTHLSGGTLISITDQIGVWTIRRFTTGEMRGRKIDAVDLYRGGSYQFSLIVTVGGSDTTVTHSASTTPEAGVVIDEYRYRDTTSNIDVLTVKVAEITLSPGVTHTWSYTIDVAG